MFEKFLDLFESSVFPIILIEMWNQNYGWYSKLYVLLFSFNLFRRLPFFFCENPSHLCKVWHAFRLIRCHSFCNVGLTLGYGKQLSIVLSHIPSQVESQVSARSYILSFLFKFVSLCVTGEHFFMISWKKRRKGFCSCYFHSHAIISVQVKGPSSVRPISTNP